MFWTGSHEDIPAVLELLGSSNPPASACAAAGTQVYAFDFPWFLLNELQEILLFPGQSPSPISSLAVGNLNRPGLPELITAISIFHSKVSFSLRFILFWLSSPGRTDLTGIFQTYYRMFVLILLIFQLYFLNPGIARLSHCNHSYFVSVASVGVRGVQLRRFEIRYPASIPCSFPPLRDARPS